MTKMSAEPCVAYLDFMRSSCQPGHCRRMTIFPYLASNNADRDREIDAMSPLPGLYGSECLGDKGRSVLTLLNASFHFPE